MYTQKGAVEGYIGRGTFLEGFDKVVAHLQEMAQDVLSEFSQQLRPLQ